MVVDAAGKVQAVSANTRERLGLDPDALLGNSLWHAISSHPTWLSHLHAVMRTFEAGQERWLTAVDMLGLPWEVKVSEAKWGSSQGTTHFMLEWMPGSSLLPEEERHLFESVSQALRGLNEALSMQGYLDRMCRSLQRFTGYERVLVYRFDEDWSGQVVAEAAAAGEAPRYLDHRFPATDIPSQARALYVEQPVRVIADVDAEPVPLIGVPGVAPGLDDLDLGLSMLRAVSPNHLQYLRNMGVRASVVLSLIHRGSLWGMLVCHHPSPRVPPRHMTHSLCVASEIMLGNVTSHIDSLQALETTSRALHVQQTLSRLERSLEHMGQTFSMAHSEPALLAAFEADAVSICYEGEMLCGDPLPAELLHRLQTHWDEAGELVFRSHQLGAAWPDWDASTWPYAGVLACRLGEGVQSWIVFARCERAQDILWAGNPHEKAVADTAPPVLTPRASFETWVQSVRHQARPWQDADEHAMVELTRIILLRRQSWAVRRYQETLRQFMETQESTLQGDRARIALLVHDQLGQLMAAARLKIGHLSQDVPPNETQRRMAQSAMDDLEEAMEVARNISHHLYPLGLRHGLMVALESLVDEFTERSGLSIRLEGPAELPGIPQQVAEVFFGIAREALNNVVRHAQAKHVDVRVQTQAGFLDMQVRDDGMGFPEVWPPQHTHFGLFGMRERASWIQAELSLDNLPGGGACVSLRWRWPTREEV